MSNGDTTPEWLGDFDGLEEGDVNILSRYDSVDSALKGVASKDRTISSSFRIPDENTSEEDRNKFHQTINKYRGVPEKAEDYEIEHPELPEGMEHDTEFENKIRQAALEEGVSAKALKRLGSLLLEHNIGRHNAMIEAANNEGKATIDKYIDENGQQKANEILGYTDKEGKQIMGTAKRGFMGASKELGLDYVDDHNNPQSHLVNCLEEINKNGILGNKLPMIKLGQMLFETRYKEGNTPPGTPPQGGGESEVFSEEFYAKTDDGKDVE